jgi:hypothetical protein
LQQARLAEFHFGSDYYKALDRLNLAFIQRLASDTAGAKATAEHVRNTLEPLCKDQPDIAEPAAYLSQAYAVMGEKDLALKAAARAIMLIRDRKDAVNTPSCEENMALIQTIFGENGHAISTLTRLLQTPYWGWNYSLTPITPALLRFDPLWDPLRADPVFQKLCEEKQP